MTTVQHCPGFSDLKSMKTFICKCTHCGQEKEIFSDELSKKQMCPGCGQELDTGKCVHEGG